MSDVTKRGLLALGLGIVLVILSVALNRSDNETVHAITLIVDLMGGVLIVLGVLLAVLGLFRRA